MKNDNMQDSAADRLKEIREATGMSQKDFAELFGITPSTYNRYESGMIGQMKSTAIKAICKKYNINIGWFMGLEDDKYILPEKALQEIKRLPILGKVKPKVSIYSQEDIIDYSFVSKSDPADFCIIAPDDSMSGARIHKGDIVYLKMQDEAQKGDIVLVEFEDEITLRRLVVLADGTELLVPEDGSHSGTLNIVPILGKATFIRAEVK